MAVQSVLASADVGEPLFRVALRILWKDKATPDVLVISSPAPKADVDVERFEQMHRITDHLTKYGMRGWMYFSGFYVAMDCIAYIAVDLQPLPEGEWIG